jgi:hypothetical protein
MLQVGATWIEEESWKQKFFWNVLVSKASIYTEKHNMYVCVHVQMHRWKFVFQRSWVRMLDRRPTIVTEVFATFSSLKNDANYRRILQLKSVPKRPEVEGRFWHSSRSQRYWHDNDVSIPFILWHIDPLLGNDHEIKNYITAVAR